MRNPVHESICWGIHTQIHTLAITYEHVLCLFLSFPAYSDRSFKFIVKSPATSWFVKKCVGVEKGSARLLLSFLHIEINLHSHLFTYLPLPANLWSTYPASYIHVSTNLLPIFISTYSCCSTYISVIYIYIFYLSIHYYISI